MSVRAAKCSLGVICVIGLAAVGIGWQVRLPARQPGPRQVFCNIEELEQYHPAWRHLAEASMMPISPREEGSQTTTGRAVLPSPAATRGPVPGTASRAGLQARFDERAEEELSRISEELNASVTRRVAERRRELEAQAKAADGEEMRLSEESVARELRTLDEARMPDRVGAAIKLAALRAQLSVRGVDKDPIRKAIAGQEQVLAGLASEEEALREKAAAELESKKSQRRSAISKELADLRAGEERRVEGLIQSRRERLCGGLSGGATVPHVYEVAAQGRGPVVAEYPAASELRASAKSRFAAVAAASRADMAEVRELTRARVDAELRAVVSRIARENGLEVTFKPGSKAQDRTGWFRQRLPYPGV